MSQTPDLNCTTLDHPSWTLPLVLYQSERLSAYRNRLIHGFTGKPYSLGGVHTPREIVLSHRAALCETLRCDVDRLIVPDQVHGAQSKTTTDKDFQSTDAVILLEPHTPVLLMFADCTPVLLYDPKRHLGAVIHAGWRGTAQQIAAKTAKRLIDEFGCQPEDLMGIIGPAIGGCCYEVSTEVTEALSQSTHADSSHFITLKPSGKAHVDLQTVNRLQLEEQGLTQIEILQACTHCETEALWSYRRGEAGRQGAFMMLL